MAQAGKRLSTSDPDKLRARPPTLQWWDMMRFVWRGAIAIEARGFEFNLAACEARDIGERTQRLAVTAAKARIHLAFGSCLRLHFDDFTGACFRVCGGPFEEARMLASVADHCLFCFVSCSAEQSSNYCMHRKQLKSGNSSMCIPCPCSRSTGQSRMVACS